uniref:Uncharacterized protein n=1 Tax=Romanomermis culicivorax TaxID=13658 RepID=A0A915IS67_ROMCU
MKTIKDYMSSLRSLTWPGAAGSRRLFPVPRARWTDHRPSQQRFLFCVERVMENPQKITGWESVGAIVDDKVGCKSPSPLLFIDWPPFNGAGGGGGMGMRDP